MVYCNNEVVAIDFNVKDSARYPFFIEEDLCEVRIERKGDKFQYFLESNRDVDTPFNQERKHRDKREQRFLRASVGGLLLFATAVALLIAYAHKQSLLKARAEMWQYHGEETVAKAYPEQDKKGKRWIVYSYAGGGQVRHGRAELPPHGALPNGMPLEPGDAFTVRFHSGRPEVAVMDFEKPAPELLERYRQRALRVHQRLHPELAESRAACELDLAFVLKKIGGYADFYWQAASPEENPEHNRDSYLRLVRDIPFARLSRERCMN